MTAETLDCPRCRIPLVRGGGERASLRCAACGGVWMSAEDLRSGPVRLEEELRIDDGAGRDAANCPQCRIAMQPTLLGDAAFDRCPVCCGLWLDRDEALPGSAADSPEGTVAALGRALLYSLSLPERAIRSTVGLAAGAAQEAAALLVPQAFQSSKTYEVVIRNSLRFLTQDVGGVKAPESGGAPPVQDYLARKAIGNFVDLAGLATLHVSPLWLLAVVSDVAYGSETFVRELAVELQKQGVIDEGSTIHGVDDLLAAVRRTSGSAAGLFDTPPLDADQLQETLRETREAIASADPRLVLPEEELRRYWNELREIAGQEGVSLVGVSGAVTMHALGKLQTVSRGALTGLQVAGGLLQRNVLGHYADAFRSIHERGFYRTLQESSEPYVAAVWSNFAADRETWTADLLTGRTFAKAYQTVSGWFRGQPAPESETNADR